MKFIDNAIGLLSPGWLASRLKSRAVIKAYEAATPSRTHKARRERRTANQLTQSAAVSLREQARWMDCNHDLVIGVLDKLEERIIGAKGIIVEPQPQFKSGAVATKFAAQIRSKWGAWSVSPEVTEQFTRPVLERLLLRSWLRDGEVFTQLVKGSTSDLTPVAGVPFWLEALEADFVPIDQIDPTKGLFQGIFFGKWGRPKKYLVYEQLPTSSRIAVRTKEIDADNMLHLKFTRRLHQARGTTILAGVLTRLSALKDYEDAELTAARIAAALGMYIKKGDGQVYTADDAKKEEREMEIVPGMLFDDLEAGEDIGMIKSDRPNPNLEPFRNGQLRAVSAGVRVSYSSTSRNYDGTYSAQRQELVESTDGYFILQDTFIGAVTRPMFRAWLQMAIASGQITPPPGIDMGTLYNAVYSGPVMPWIDPLKEANAWKTQIRGGAATEGEWVRARGANPDEVKRRRKAEIDENLKQGLTFDTDPANDKGAINNVEEKQDQEPSEGSRYRK
jgi:lambda family phage portal protein